MTVGLVSSNERHFDRNENTLRRQEKEKERESAPWFSVPHSFEAEGVWIF